MRKYCLLIAITIACLMFTGCSVLGYKTVVKPETSDEWVGVTERYMPYDHEFSCNNQLIGIREVRVAAEAYYGIPIIPFLGPGDDYEGPEKLIIKVTAASKDSMTLQSPGDIKLIFLSDSSSHTPANIITYTRDWSDGIFLRENYYEFDLHRLEVEPFELVFLFKFNGCEVPRVVFKKDRQMRYSPIIPPFDTNDWQYY